MKPVIIIGSGGHAKVLINSLQLTNTQIIGLTDRDESKIGQKVLGVPVLGNDNIISDYNQDEVLLVNGLGSLGVNQVRKSIFDKYKKAGYSFAEVIHPSAVVANDTVIGEGVQIMAGVIIQPGTTIKSNTIINTKASIDHDCTIGSHVHVAPGVTVSGGVHIEDDVHIGTGASLIQGLKICQGSIIAAGAVVVNNLPPGVTVQGIPAKEYNGKGNK